MKATLTMAKALALEASEAVLKLLHQPIQKNLKKDNSWVTEADLESDKIIREGLQKAFPDHAILTEENGLSGNTNSEWTWLVDPLDGTKAYAKGIAGFSVMIGLLKKGEPYLGVVVDPLQGFVYEAVRGEGAYLDGKKLQVSNRNDFAEMSLVLSTGFPKEKLSTLRELIPGPLCEPINSVGIKVGMLVRQEADIYLSHHSVHYWDTCAPQVILEEAGGFLTRLDGRSLQYDLSKNPSHEALIVGSNGQKHPQLIEKISTLNL